MNGFYPMLNEVHDKAVRDLPLAECALFEHLWRKLIGWNQFEDEISISQLVKETKACRATIINLLKNLEEKRWIVITRQSSKTRRKFTSKIALPRCPGIESRLGWSNIHTRGSLDSIPGGGIESRHTTDSSSTDSFTDKKKEEKPVVPTSYEEKKELWEAKILEAHGVPHWDEDLIDGTYRLSIKIREAFGGDCCLAHDGDTQLILMQLMAYDESDVLAVAGDRNTPGRTSQGIEWVLDNMEGR